MLHCAHCFGGVVILSIAMVSFGSVAKESDPRDRVPNLDHRRYMVTRVVFDAIPQVVIVAMEKCTYSVRGWLCK